MRSKNTDIAKRCEDLGIIAFDGDIETKEDVMLVLDLIEEITKNEHKKIGKRMRELQKKYRGVPKI